MADNTNLTVTTSGLPAGLQNAVMFWADARTDAASLRRHDLLRDKVKAVGDFFEHCQKHPGQVTPIDVKTWQAHLEAQGLAPATVYARVSRVSSFYDWALADDTLAETVRANPVNLARPKAPRPYQTESTQALTDEEAAALLAVVKARGGIVGKRDYALLLMYLTTGMRRSEVINLTWGDVRFNGVIVLTGKVKGGDYQARQVSDPAVKDALLDYLASAGRLDSMTSDTPLWTRHDRAGKPRERDLRPGKALTGHAFAKNLKRYASEAGLDDIHLHQTRHTYARMVGDESGSVVETQDALGHKNANVTRVYLQRIGVKRDKWSAKIAQRLGAAVE